MGFTHVFQERRMSTTYFDPVAMPVPSRARPGIPARRPAVAPGFLPAPARPGWIERLARWADARPPHHHRLGSWTMGR